MRIARKRGVKPQFGRFYSSFTGSPQPESKRADDGDRTRDPQLGKLMLYQLSYVREAASG
jgi:hypothetical protein